MCLPRIAAVLVRSLRFGKQLYQQLLLLLVLNLVAVFFFSCCTPGSMWAVQVFDATCALTSGSLAAYFHISTVRLDNASAWYPLSCMCMDPSRAELWDIGKRMRANDFQLLESPAAH